MFLFWPDLEEVHCQPYLLNCLVNYRKKIRKRHLEPFRYCPERMRNYIASTIASTIARELPQLELLDLRKCFVSSRALFTVLKGLKGLKCLDTRHTILYHEEYPMNRRSDENPIAWNEVEIGHNFADITYLKCSRESCSECSKYYTKTSPVVWT